MPPRNPLPVPNLQNGALWHHIASERELKRAIRDRNAEIIEVPMISMCFIVSYRDLVIVRSAILGGDVRDIEGGWAYASDLRLRADVQEIRGLARNVGTQVIGGLA